MFLLYSFNSIMIDLHTHSIFSDGELIPAELIRRAAAIGYEAIAVTDHMDHSNIDFIIPRIIKAVDALKPYVPLTVIPGAEITHVPPPLIPEIVKEARKLGAKIVIVHGETIVEPVMAGTNTAAIEAGADILAHPGIISYDDLLYAKEKGVALEISARKGHSLANGHVTKWALRLGIPLVVNTDAHSPSDLIGRDLAGRILLAAGYEESILEQVFRHSRYLVEKAIRG